MSKILNIGVLDVREIKEEIAKEITSIENIGLLIESDESQKLLAHVSKQNIGASIKIPIDKDIKLVLNNGDLKVDRDYLEGIDGNLALIINGDLRFTEDVTSQLINEKVYLIIINGNLMCPKNISGTILSKTTINGSTIIHKSRYIFFPGVTQLTDRFLKRFREKSNISFEKLIIGEELDINLLNEKIDSIEVVEKMISLDKYEDDIYPFIDEYYDVATDIVPYDSNGIKYIQGDTKLHDSDVQSYSGIVLYVDGDLELDLSENIDFKQHIDYVICDKIILNDNIYSKIRDVIGTDVEVEIFSGRLMINKGKMIISDNYNQKVSIKNMGKLIFEESVDAENLEKFIYSIDNYGVIEAPANLINALNNKTNKNYGKIRNQLPKSDNQEVNDKEKEKQDIMYTNMGELKL